MLHMSTSQKFVITGQIRKRERMVMMRMMMMVMMRMRNLE